MLIGYGRISKGEDQDDTLQVQALKEAATCSGEKPVERGCG
jgi:hypothetical protein